MNGKYFFGVFVLLMSLLACQGSIPRDTPGSENLTPVSLTQTVSGDDGGSIPEEHLQSQIIIVMDVSGSMAGFVVPNPPPAELRQILDDIYAVENDPEIKQLEDELDAILDQPVIKNADTALAKASYDRLKYIEDDLGVDIFALVVQIRDLLKERGCEDHAANLVVDEPSVNEALFNLQRACRSVTEPDKNDLRDDIAFLDDPHVQELTAAIDEFTIEYREVIRATDYDEISRTLEQLYKDSGYYDLNKELNQWQRPFPATATALAPTQSATAPTTPPPYASAHPPPPQRDPKSV